MQISITVRQVHNVTIDGETVETTFEPNGPYDIKAEKVGDTLILTYLTPDHDFDDNLEDCMGKLYSFHKHADREDHIAGLEALGRCPDGDLDESLEPDADAVSLACYDHGGQVWSISGEGTQCQFDTARGAGVWVPDKLLREQLDSDEAAGMDRREKAVEYCKQFLDTYNSVQAGEVYGVVVETYTTADGEWASKDHDTVWGHIGHEYATEAMLDAFTSAVSQEKLRQSIANRQ